MQGSTSLTTRRRTVNLVVLEHVPPTKVSGPVTHARRTPRVLAAARRHVNARRGPSM